MKRILITSLIWAAVVVLTAYVVHLRQPGLAWQNYLKSCAIWAGIFAVPSLAVLIIGASRHYRGILITSLAWAVVVVLTAYVIHRLQPRLSWDDYLKALGVWAGAWAAVGAAILAAIVATSNIGRQIKAASEQDQQRDALAQQSEDRKRKLAAFERLNKLSATCYSMLHRLQDNSYKYPAEEVDTVLKGMEEAKSELDWLQCEEYRRAWENFLQKAIFVHQGAIKLLADKRGLFRRKPDFRTFYGQNQTGIALGKYKRTLEKLAERFTQRMD